MKTMRFKTNSPWEKYVGYCRAIRAGEFIFLSGTASIDTDGSTFAPGDAYVQTQKCFEITEQVLKEMGTSKDRIVRTRMYVKNIEDWEVIGKAHREFFSSDAVPAATMVEISSLIRDDLVVEIEADAHCGA